MGLSVNKLAEELVKEMIADPLCYNVAVHELSSGAKVIDAGVEAGGGFRAGLKAIEICMGGLGDASFCYGTYGELFLPSVFVSTDYPAIALLGSQFAGWQIKVGEYFAMGSGPARALAKKPSKMYAKIGYEDQSDVAVIFLEADKLPDDEVAKFVADACGVSPKNLYMVVAPTSCIVGSIQVSGRVAETGLHKMFEEGLDPTRVLFACGCAPIASIHGKSVKAMGRTNDMILYGGTTFYVVDYEKDEELAEMVEKTPSSASRDYGKPFYEIFKEAGFDFYKVDPGLFAPAYVVVNNVRTGSTIAAGKLNAEVVHKSLTSS